MGRMKARLAWARRPFERLAKKRREYKEKHGKWRVSREMIYAVTGDPRALNTDRKLNDFRMEQQAVREQMDEERRVKKALEGDPVPYSCRGVSIYAHHLARARSSMESALQLGAYMLKGKEGSWLEYDLQLLRLHESSLHSQMERLCRQLGELEKAVPTLSQEAP